MPGKNSARSFPNADTGYEEGLIRKSTAVISRTHRWSSVRNKTKLLHLMESRIGGIAQKTAAEVKRIASLMPITNEGETWGGGKLRKGAK